MKQPLLSEHDSAPRKSELTSCKMEERRATGTMFVKILLVGAAAGIFLQAVAFSTFVTILSNCAMYYILFLMSQAD
jgi:hypothetical protein